MADPTLPQDFLNTIKSILKRLNNLEGRGIGNSLTVHTTAEQNGINIVNANDTEIARFGVLQRSNVNPILNFESDGIAVFNQDTGNTLAIWYDYVKGCIFPLVPTPWQKSGSSVIVTSGTFANIFDTISYAIPSKWVQCLVVVATDVGTTAEVKMQVAGVDMGTTQTVASGATNTLWWKEELTQVVGAGPVQFNLQVRRASGAGNVYVFEPRNLSFGNPHTLPASSWEVS